MDNDVKGVQTTRSMYERFMNGSSGANKGRFELSEDFRAGFSSYGILNGDLRQGKNCKWDARNFGGVPMDFDRQNGVVYVDGSDAHTLLMGATGSKKSRLVAMPTARILADAGESMIICDPKGEIYRRTAAYMRDRGFRVNVIDLREPDRGDCWNLLSIPYELFQRGEVDKACAYVNDATINLIPIESKDPYWEYSARDMLFGLTILLFEICREKKLPDDAANIQNVLRLRDELFSSVHTKEIIKNVVWAYAQKFELVRSKLGGIIICPADTMACIISMFDQHMSCFSMQPQIISMLSTSTVKFHDLGFQKQAVFLIMPDEKSTYHKLVTIFIKQIYELLIDVAFKECEDNVYPKRINFLLDEFSSLPAISDFPQMITASRSRNIRFILIVQSKHQLIQRYGEETETIQSNCGNWLFLTSREISVLREISELSGQVDREPLISVSRLQHLDKDTGECLVLSGRLFPYFAILADIDEYDGMRFETLTPLERPEKECEEYSFACLLKPDEGTVPLSNADEFPMEENKETMFDLDKSNAMPTPDDDLGD